MDDSISRLEARVDGLSASLGEVERRLLRLEEYLAMPREEEGMTEAAEAAPGRAPTGEAVPEAAMDVTSGLSFTGRTLICLAGAYLPRAMTSEGLLPEAVGAGLGMAYAVLWIFMADRAGGRGRRANAGFHGATATLVGLPLIWETTTRFELLSPAAGAAALTALAALSLFVAWRRNLRAVAWIASLGAALTALALGGRTHAPLPYAGLLVALGVATLWLAQTRLAQTRLARDRAWRGLPWVIAAAADLAVLLLWAEDPIAKEWATAGGVLAVQLGLFVLYAASFLLLRQREDRQIGLGAALQTAIAAAVGYGGAVAVAGSDFTAAVILGGISLMLALAAYTVAFEVVAEEHKRDALYVSGLGVPLALGGGHLLLDRPALLWAAVAILCSWLGSRFSRLTLSGHATLYALVAAVASELILEATQALTSAADAAWSPVRPGAVLAFLAIVACLAFRVRGDVAFWGSWATVPKLLLLILGCWTGGGLLIRWVGPLAAGEPGAGADPAILAAVRTAVLAASALLLAAVGRSRHLREASWLVYPVLAVGALKLLVEDLPTGRPTTLLIAFALYGGALIAAPRLRRRQSRGDGTEIEPKEESGVTPVQKTGNGSPP